MRRNIDVTKKPSREQLAMLERAAEMPVPADAEYPELSEDELLQFTKVSDEQGHKRGA